MKIKNLKDVIKNCFSFLENEFNFKLNKISNEKWGVQAIYINNSTGVIIRYEYQEAYFFILLYKLVDGKLIENPIIIKQDSTLLGYGLDDLISLTSPSAIIGPAYNYEKEIKYYENKDVISLYTSFFADNLKKYAKNILLGDFTEFDKLDTIVKERLKRNN